jgi:hypothetical protein
VLRDVDNLQVIVACLRHFNICLPKNDARDTVNVVASNKIVPALREIVSLLEYPTNFTRSLPSVATKPTMAYRLNTLGLLSEWQYKSLCIQLGRLGYRSAEPVGIERETSLIWRKVLSHLWAEKTTKNDIAATYICLWTNLKG